jgi:hypothetical protein
MKVLYINILNTLKSTKTAPKRALFLDNYELLAGCRGKSVENPVPNRLKSLNPRQNKRSALFVVYFFEY